MTEHMPVDQASQDDYRDFWGTNDVINSTSGVDQINLNSYDSDYITLHSPDFIELNMEPKSKKYKYSEETILKELTEYISNTYRQHYSTGNDNIQTLDLIEACGDGEPFCRSNILKYASRYDRKGTSRRDILKILHYAVLLLHFNDKNAQRETYPQ
tara:strand:+ start:62066 stop:62533 length:468 start_codon:yes stop_codon:yes gene_type:complete